jgi:murein DD-endopeptidase MepM/ murein hydrolase activator NlpD
VNKKIFNSVAYMTVATVMVLAFAVSVYKAGDKEEQNARVDTQSSLSADSATGDGAAAVAKSGDKSYKETTTRAVPQATTSAEKEVTETTTRAVATAPKATAAVSESEPRYTLFDDGNEMTMPCDGQIVMDYSADTAVYDATLDQYRTNDSICISADTDSEVRAAFDGVVEAVTNDRENGNSVVLAHGNGWRTTYSQLSDNVLVTEGEVVCEGDVVGYVGTPSVYSEALGPHLTFTVSKDDMSVDPKTVLRMEE